jgi:hypothetical protein
MSQAYKNVVGINHFHTRCGGRKVKHFKVVSTNIWKGNQCGLGIAK